MRKVVERSLSPVGEGSYEHSNNRVAYEIPDQPAGEFLAMSTSANDRSTAPMHETSLFSLQCPFFAPFSLGEYPLCPFKVRNEEIDSRRSFFLLDDSYPTFNYVFNEHSVPEIPDRTSPRLMESTPPLANNNDSLTSITLPGSPTTQGPEDPETVDTENATKHSPSTIASAIIPDLDNFFEYSSDSSVDTPFDFVQELGTNLETFTERFYHNDWPHQDHLGEPTSFATMKRPYAEKGRGEWTEDYLEFGPDTLPGCYYDRQQSLSPLTHDCVMNPECATKQPPPLLAPPAESSGSLRRKRPASIIDSTSEAEQNDRKKRARWTETDDNEKPLACPFHKRDPQRYPACGKYTLRRIKDVKQHIYRLHCKPEIYCPLCFGGFKCSDERDKHVREKGCTTKAIPATDGILSEDTKRKLKDCGVRARGNKHQQWMSLWEVIFPEVSRPRSPYVENDQVELLDCMRDSWENTAEYFITRFLRENHAENIGPIQIRQVIGSFLDYIETTMTYGNCDADGKSAPVNQRPVAPERFFKGMRLLAWKDDPQSEISLTNPAAINSPDVKTTTMGV